MKLYLTLLIGVLIAVPNFAAYGQQTSGEVTGTVTDASGAVIIGATVTATNAATQQVRTTTSNASGNYVIPYLAPGTYNLQCKKAGFKLVKQPNISVTVGAVLAIAFNMEVGEVTQEVTVSTAVPLLSTQSTAIETNIGGHQIVSLPLNGRDYLQLVALTPDVVNEATSNGGSGLMGGVRDAESISIAGQRLEFNHYTLDGVENTDPDFNTYIIHPSVDALQEFTVLTGIYSAEFGRGAGQINANTLPGTNTYHGVAYDFIRNDYVDAKLWRQVGKKNPFHRNDYGFTLDGPLSIPRLFNAKDKLFFESSFENLQDHELVQEIGSVPTKQMRLGQLNIDTIPQIYFPTSRTFAGSGGTATPVSYNGQNNVIPPNDIASQATAIINFLYPLPSPNPDATVYANDYVAQNLQPTESTQFNQRIDWTENAKSNWFGRFSWENDLSANATLFEKADNANVTTTVRQAVIGNTYIISPRVVNDARFAWNQFNNNYAGYYYGSSTDVAAQLGIGGFTSAGGPATYGVPAIGMSEGISGGGGVTPWITRDDTFQWLDSVSVIRGNHSLKVGGMFERDRFNNFGNQKSVGEFDFDGQSTNDPGSPQSTGFAFADLLFGYPSQYYRVQALPQAELRRSGYAAFIEDDWKVTRSLTLNLGLRYDNNRPWIDKHDSIINMEIFKTGVTTGTSSAPWVEPVSTLVPGTPNPIITRPGSGDFYEGIPFRFGGGQLVQRGNQYMGRSTVQPSNFDYGPRIGLNYALGTKWSFRTGFGIFYTNDIGNAVFDMVRNIGGKDGTVVSSSSRANVSLTNPWANETGSASCPGYTGVCVLAPQIQANDHGNRTPYVEQYIANVERQLTQNVAIDIGYMGNQAHHLDRDLIINQAVPKSGPTDTSSTKSRRPFPLYGPIQDMADWDRSAYNSADVKLTQRVSHGLLYVVAFTWSHAIDYGSAVRSNSGDTLWPTNSYNLRGERGPSQFDLRRRFVGSFVYTLPFGAGKGFGPTSRIMNHIVSGWTVGGILTLADGTPRNASQLGDTAGLGTLGNQPDATGASYIPSHRSAAKYWNPAAFDYTNPALSYRTGTMMRMTLVGPGTQNFDSNIARTFHIWESHVLEFRVEAFNTLNHPNWIAPSSSDTRSLSTFGVITRANPMRELQGALKYSF